MDNSYACTRAKELMDFAREKDEGTPVDDVSPSFTSHGRGMRDRSTLAKQARGRAVVRFPITLHQALPLSCDRTLNYEAVVFTGVV